MLTLDQLKKMEPGEVFAKGIVSNSPDGVYMSDSELGRDLMWVAKRGNIHDWTIYIHWSSFGEEYILKHGDKLVNNKYIKQLVPCEDEAFNLYRF